MEERISVDEVWECIRKNPGITCPLLADVFSTYSGRIRPHLQKLKSEERLIGEVGYQRGTWGGQRPIVHYFTFGGEK